MDDTWSSLVLVTDLYRSMFLSRNLALMELKSIFYTKHGSILFKCFSRHNILKHLLYV